LYRAFPERLERLDPYRWSPVIEYAVVLVVLEDAVALGQSEALEVIRHETRGPDFARVVEPAPDSLTVGRYHRKSVGVVHLRTPVEPDGAVRLRVPEHGGQWCDAQALDLVAEEQPTVDIDDLAFTIAVRQSHLVGAGHTWRVE